MLKFERKKKSIESVTLSNAHAVTPPSIGVGVVVIIILLMNHLT